MCVCVIVVLLFFFKGEIKFLTHSEKLKKIKVWVRGMRGGGGVEETYLINFD